MSDETTLLPCPFCGGDADEYEGDYGNGIYCMMCGAMMGEQINLEYVATKRVSIAEAIAAWNTRACCEEGAIIATEENMAAYGWVRERTCHIVRETKTLRSFVHGEVEVTDEKCSECGGFVDVGCGVIRNYCPECGARVIGKTKAKGDSHAVSISVDECKRLLNKAWRQLREARLENAKMRELVDELYPLAGYGAMSASELDRAHDLMRELGVEV